LRTKPRHRTINSIVKTRKGVRVSRAARDANAQGEARRRQPTKNRRAWDVGSRNAADSATLAAHASETTRVVTGAGVLRPEHVAAVTDALMYEHRLNTLVTCSCCDCRISVVNMDGHLFRRNEPPASTLLRGIVVPTSPPIDLGPLARADFANSHDVRFCWDCKAELDKKQVPIAALLNGNAYRACCSWRSRRWAARSPSLWRLQEPPRTDQADGSSEL